MKGLNGSDTLYGGDDKDDLRGGGGADELFGGAQDDKLRGNQGNDLLYGGEGNDSLSGGFGDDTAYGEGGNDTFFQINDGATNTLYGGTGLNVLNLSGSSAGWEIGAGGISAVSGGSNLVLADINHFIMSDFADTVNGTSGDDTISGLDGDDTLYGGSGTDTIYGGAGNDIIQDRFDDCLLFGGEGNDTLIGSNGTSTIYGGSGSDYMVGGSGTADLIFNGVSELDSGDSISGIGGTSTVIINAEADGDFFDFNGVWVRNMSGLRFGATGTNLDVTTELLSLDIDPIKWRDDLVVTGNDASGST
ncbi:MAG: calcium-binding protein, partial [Hyphomicrobiales bacterium]|nr:calcium-binding protein [Hyphomicrobiales bacterium]